MPTFTETPSVTLVFPPTTRDNLAAVERRSVPIILSTPVAISIHSRGTWADTFTRANSTTISDASHPWVEDESQTLALQILTNQLRAVSFDGAVNVSGFAFWNQDPGSSHRSSLVFQAHNPGLANARSGPAVRIQTSSTNTSFTGYVAVCDPAGALIDLRRYQSSSLLTVPLTGTSLGTAAVTFNAGTVIRIEAVGSTITVKADNVVVIEVLDTAISGGRPGAVVVPGYTI